MDGGRFDEFTRGWHRGQSRRSLLKGLFGIGAAIAAGGASSGVQAAWSTLVCLPDGQGGFIDRLVPTAAVPFYVARYGAEIPIPVNEACAGQCGGTVNLNCGETAVCPAICGGACDGDCPSDTFCRQRNQDLTYVCVYGDWTSCVVDEVDCVNDSDCHIPFSPREVCREDVCVVCMDDADCGDGWTCLRMDGCVAGSGFCAQLV